MVESAKLQRLKPLQPLHEDPGFKRWFNCELAASLHPYCAEEYLVLRTKRRLVGAMVGGLPGYRQQDQMRGLPVRRCKLTHRKLIRRLDPVLKALVFQLLESTSLSKPMVSNTSLHIPKSCASSAWRRSRSRCGTVGQCKLNPGLKAPGFKSSS